MKLIYCPECQDVRKLHVGERVECQCGESWGWYKNILNAVVGGKAIPIGFNNRSFRMALNARMGSRYKERNFTAFTINEIVSDTVERVE